MTHKEKMFLQDMLSERRGFLRGVHVTDTTAPDFAEYQSMELAGYLERVKTPAFCRPDDVVFKLSQAGRDAIAETGAAA